MAEALLQRVAPSLSRVDRGPTEPSKETLAMPHRLKGATTPAVQRNHTRLGEQVEAVLGHWRESLDHTDQTRTRMSETVGRFSARLEATGVSSLDRVTVAGVCGFVGAPTRTGAAPELATQHTRRTTLRALFRTARHLGLCSTDPTLDLALPARGSLVARPLTEDEVSLCRASVRTAACPAATLRATAWALGEATAVSSEIAAVRLCDLDDPGNPTMVHLPGTRRHDPRAGWLTPWGIHVLRDRAAYLLGTHATPETLLAYGGAAPPGGAKAQAAVCNALRDVLDAAGLLAEPDVRPASLRNWAGRSAYDRGMPVEQIARLLGMRSLDATAEDIALTWRTDTDARPP